MNTYPFTISIEAYSEEEARAKLDLMLQWACFPGDRDLTALGTAGFAWLLQHCLAKPQKPLSPKYQRKTVPKK
jgi:hypothetical protein